MPAISSTPPENISFKTLSKNLKAVTKNPEDFLRAQHLTSEKIRKLLQHTYDFTTAKHSSNKNATDFLPELVVDDLDAEQIWQLVELRNNVVFPQFLENASKILSLKEDRIQINYVSNGEEAEDYGSEEEQDNPDGDSDLDKSNESEFGEEEPRQSKNKTEKKVRKNGKPSIVDDKFFKLSEMEAFLKEEDEKELNKHNSNKVKDDFSINMFDKGLESEEDEENVCYKDFFDEQDTSDRQLSEDNDENSDNSEEDDDEIDGKSNNDETEELDEKDHNNEAEESDSNESHISENEEFDNSVSETNKEKLVKSSFEDRQERLNQRIRDYEQEILGEKPWQLKGEINATNRPQNSLLEEILEFEATSRPAPIITEETTLRLEDIVRQRIKDQVWDDVELKIKPLNTPQEYRKQLVLDQEKSKESLAHIYEKQYQNEIEKLDPNAAEAREEEEPKAHTEIKQMMNSLFIKLDALSNFHFTPKPVAPEPKILTNTPAVNIEEVAPVAVSSAKLLAPEEIRKRAKGEILGSNERNKTDKNRDRRHKKLKQKAIHKALEEKNIQKQKLGIKISKKDETTQMTNQLTKRRNVEKISTSQDNGTMKSSKAFFNKLNETTTLQKNNKKKTKPDTSSLSAKKLKL
ncbi:U3 small nucleolar ribonucleoprotein protein MPP10 [Eupeodes corollae]|uniref:U3 small nucleolar ribonucleoprotein protein MPP10 n=1 Tax=Eupeodes corollae TaxID=290404 RepID=UPI00249071DE|nr:U3 small nucleolar ribonucleoprotein protein MPP10 [Eupeodes corollae]